MDGAQKETQMKVKGTGAGTRVWKCYRTRQGLENPCIAIGFLIPVCPITDAHRKSTRVKKNGGKVGCARGMSKRTANPFLRIIPKVYSWYRLPSGKKVN